MCLHTWAGGRADACAALEYFDLFIFFVGAKKARKIPSVVCVEGRIVWAACVPVPASLPRFLPAANLVDGDGGGGGGADIWEQFLSAPAKVVKGLISSHAGARAKKTQLPPRIQHNLPIKTSLSVWETSINNISSVQIR